MSTVSVNLKKWYQEYKNWVCEHPQGAVEVESALRLFSFFITGRLSKSIVASELVHSATSLFSLFNDHIISSSKQKVEVAGNDIKSWLTILYYCEVFIEKGACSLWGERGKWSVIVSVQIIKWVANMVLLLHYNEKVISHPPIPPMSSVERVNTIKNSNNNELQPTDSFLLRRSGRVIRKVEAAPSFQNRIWKPPVLNHHTTDNREEPDRKLLQQLLLGELIHLSKPIVHLAAIRKYGSSSWKQWVIPFAMDIFSLYCLERKNYERNPVFTSREKHEISKRYLSLLLYLMRSPFYERHSEVRLNAILDILGKVIPFIPGSFKNGLIPIWRNTYFYMWSS